ncbi:hypothetical protein NL108_013650 [Boleophthalmus pectinirostris]|uniref:cystein proteinase inhibitor protein salarin-like n=1 Tax=Boleophthalmus pectinirostris TaxID=150288 RepID=UPI000A1C3E9C|nr:cystein proteinase inhibitor protein salarin-like [Boleophthalmus pectinirostris]KAJ0066478.1 hypothetical protein NL108_013650 [Boleophthalmus pectinirostris]
MLLVHLCTLLLISSALSLPVEDRDLDKEFKEWKIKHDKVYNSPAEEAERRAIWEKTLRQVEAHNKEADRGLHTYWQGLNQFSDQKEEEWKPCLLPDIPEEPMRQFPGLYIPRDIPNQNSTEELGNNATAV